MPTRRVTVGARVGLHARPAGLLAKAAAAQTAEVFIARPGGEPVRAASMLGVMALGARYGDVVEISAEGAGAEEALAAVARVLAADPDAEPLDA
ncbi:HPr family phosphocarrier protein [Allonocardiopsis opalescens]|uniref:Phosphocarrier protein n=1 Tax=Allonocardiopsis opalescens TaxID=1144618 RepID=A0A2T0QEC7_9ACTN|nr:HPr family phosphocarrier protein [Allonocardiopsis opalescens]PRY02252.1 phosphocarrier protein [Allonocardiopsis opalescens]